MCDLMDDYIEYSGDQEFYKLLTPEEKLLYRIATRETTSYQTYVLRRSCDQLFNDIFDPIADAICGFVSSVESCILKIINKIRR